VAESRTFAHSPEAMAEFGRDLATKLRAPVLVLLSGELGAGKTTLAKGLIAGLGAAREEEVTSPTFTLVHLFRRVLDNLRVYHVDLYRVSGFADLESLGLEDVLAESAIMIVEWPDRLTLRTDWPVVRVHLEHMRAGNADDSGREITVSGLHEVLSGFAYGAIVGRTEGGETDGR
jgi:tRNA threonylcarbamoyladenosine biosynthesis protein TsaE